MNQGLSHLQLGQHGVRSVNAGLLSTHPRQSLLSDVTDASAGERAVALVCSISFRLHNGAGNHNVFKMKNRNGTQIAQYL
jgi:hypothetical protein